MFRLADHIGDLWAGTQVTEKQRTNGKQEPHVQVDGIKVGNRRLSAYSDKAGGLGKGRIGNK